MLTVYSFANRVNTTNVLNKIDQKILGKYCHLFYLTDFKCNLPFQNMNNTLSINRCEIKAIDNDTYKVQGRWHEILINQSIPLVKDDDDEYTYDDCEIFSTNQNTSYNSINVPINTSQEECDKWVYDKSTFESTFITQVASLLNQK